MDVACFSHKQFSYVKLVIWQFTSTYMIGFSYTSISDRGLGGYWNITKTSPKLGKNSIEMYLIFTCILN